MSEIRNLTRNGETFYPLTCTEGLVNRDGNVVGEINDIFDVSEYNASGTPSVLAKYDNLSLALAAVPISKQKGGMTIRYVQTSDNKYVQFRCMAQNFTTDVTQWQGIDDEPNFESNNLVKSGGIRNANMQMNKFLIPLIEGNVTELMHFVNGGVISERSTKIEYGPRTRIVSDIIYNTGNFLITATIGDNFKLMAFKKRLSDGLYIMLGNWSNTATISSESVTDAEHFVILVGKTDDSALIPADLDGKINVICHSIAYTDFVLYSNNTPKINPDLTLDLGPNPFFQIRPNKVINLSSVISDSDVYRKIPLTNNISRYSYIVFNTNNNTFRTTHRSIPIEQGELLLGTFDKENIFNYYFRFKVNFPFIKPIKIVKNDNILNELSFVNGGVVSPNIFTLGASTRLISKCVMVNSDLNLKIKNTSTTPQLKVIVTGYKDNSSVNIQGWTTSELVEVVMPNSYDYFTILLGKTNDTALSPSDINGIEVYCNPSKIGYSDSINNTINTSPHSYPFVNGYIYGKRWTDTSSSERRHICVSIPDGCNMVYMKLGSQNIQYESLYAKFIREYNVVEGQDATVVGSIEYPNFYNNVCRVKIPSEANYLYFQATSGDRDYLPSELILYFDRQEEIDSSTDILKYYSSDMMINLLSNLTRRYFRYGESATEYPPVLAFIHCSDVHADNENILRIKEFYEAYKDYIANVIDTGDFIGGSWSDGLPSSTPQVADFIRVVGNHDTMNRVGTPPNHHWETVNQKDCYDVVLKDYIGNWGVVQPEGAAENGCCYYYKDYAANHVRLIALDGEHWSTEQKNWFIGVLTDAKDDTNRGYKYHVICCVHRAPFATIAQPNNPFDSIDYHNATYANLPEAYTAVKDFIDNGGIFICWLSGHIHDDYFGLGTGDLSNQLVVGVGTAGVAPATPYSSMARTRNNISQDCFNIVGVDVTTKTLKLLRIGAHYDRYMCKKTTLSWDYEHNQLVYVD